MFDEDGSLDPFLKFLLYAVLVLAAGTILWEWLTGTAIRWITVDPWGAVAARPWWTVLNVIGFLAVLFLLARLAGTVFHVLTTPAVAGVDATSVEPEPAFLTSRKKKLEAMSPTGFEHACAELLARDGFLHAGESADQASSVGREDLKKWAQAPTSTTSSAPAPPCRTAPVRKPSPHRSVVNPIRAA